MKLAATLLLALLMAAPVSAATSSVQGSASWYCRPNVSRCTTGYPASGPYAAAGPALRDVLGADWRGKWVEVTAESGRSVVVRLIDSCWCTDGKVVDLYAEAWQRLDPDLSKGLLRVGVAEVRPDVAGALPPTDTAPRSILDFILALLGAFVAAPFSPVVRRLWLH